MKKIFGLLIVMMLCPALVNHTFAVQFGATEDFGGIDMQGFISQGFMKSEGNNFFADTKRGTFQFNELGINLSSEVGDRLRLGIQLFARDLGTDGNDEMGIGYAFADYRWKDWMGLVAGEVKLTHGLYNEVRDIDMTRTFVFLPQSVYIEGWREVMKSAKGVGAYGFLSLGNAGNLTYNLLGGVSTFGADSGAARTLEDQAFARKLSDVLPGAPGLLYLEADITTIDSEQILAGSLQWLTFINGLRMGVSGWVVDFRANGSVQITGSDSTVGQALTGTTLELNAIVDGWAWTGSLEYAIGNLVFAAEVMRATYNIVFNDAEIPEFSSIGYYGSVSYRLTDWLELGAYYSEYYSNDKDKDGKNSDGRRSTTLLQEHRAWLKETCLTTAFLVTDNWTFKVEGRLMNGAAILNQFDNPADDPLDRFEEDWYLIAAKLTYRF